MITFEPPRPTYRDRNHAGHILAEKLKEYSIPDLIVLAIPNGGIPVAVPIAKILGVPLRLTLVRKLQIPFNPEAGFGALTSDGFVLLNDRLVHHLELSEQEIAIQRAKAQQSIDERKRFFGKWARVPPLKDRRVLLVDDGLASGFTMLAAVKSVKSQGPKDIIVAVPTSSISAFRRLQAEVDKVVTPHVSRLPVYAVADAYENWYDIDEGEARQLLEYMESTEEK